MTRFGAYLWSQCLNGPVKFGKSSLKSELGVVTIHTLGWSTPSTVAGTVAIVPGSRCSINSTDVTASTCKLRTVLKA